jgi:hypothetical protein
VEISMTRYVLTRLGGSSAAAALMLGGGWLLASTPAVAAPTTDTFEFTGEPQTFAVPANVCQVTVEALGAAGGSWPASEEGDTVPGGLGARATATIAVTPGETLHVYVGGRGEDAPNEEIVPPVLEVGPGESVRFGIDTPGAAGGFNGGGDGGDDQGDDPAAGGGGASDVRQGGNALSNRVIVGGGGGGAGGNDDPGAGGGGGGSSGTEGSGGGGSPSAEGGGPGTPTEGGPGGSDGGEAGEDGSAGKGGKGGLGTDGGGGGGGGGWFGGGGGAGDDSETEDDGGGGGGGGSGFGPAGVVFELGQKGDIPSDGVVTITYDPAAGGCTEAPAVTPAAPTVAVVAEPRFTG